MFNIRVYGTLINENKQILVSDEFIRGDFYTKFPGGGLEFGEGTRDCLVREFKEETNLNVEITDHIYTTDYFQLSAFNQNHQIISIYYFVKVVGEITLETKSKPFHFEPHQIQDSTTQCEVFRWIELTDLSEESVSLPIDKIVVRIIKDRF